MFIEINGVFYNLNTILRYYLDNGNMVLFYTNGESEILYDISDRTRKILKNLLYECK